MNKKIKVFLIENNKLIQAGLVSILEDSEDIELVGIKSNIIDAGKIIDIKGIDVLIMDYNLIEKTIFDAISRLLEENKELKIVLISDNEDKSTIVKALSLGVYAYVFKDINTDILVSIIKSVYTGAMWLAPKVVEHLREANYINLPNLKPSRTNFKATHADLTQREYEVLKLIVDGKSNNDIAKILCISEHTAKAHVCNIIQKLVVDDRTQAAVKAIKNGLV